MSFRRVAVIALLGVAIPLSGQWPGLVGVEGWPAHALSHASAALVAAILAAVVGRPRGAGPRLPHAIHATGFWAVVGIALAQAIEALSAYTEREGAGPLHTATTVATMVAMAVALVAGAAALGAAHGRRAPWWAWVLAGLLALVVVVSMAGMPRL